jgi:transposase
MIEQTEIIYRWHRGDSKGSISRSLGVGRKTVRKYVNRGIEGGLSQDKPLPADHEIAQVLNQAQSKGVHPPAPVQDRRVPFDAQLAEWSKDPKIGPTQMWRLFKEQHPEVAVGLNDL